MERSCRVRSTWPIGWFCAGVCLVCFSEGCSTFQPRPASGDACPLQACGIDSCRDHGEWAFPEKAGLGYTIVLPGIWSIQEPDRWIVQGLVQAQTPSAIELYDWTAGSLLLFYNLCALERNRREARTIAGKIMAYQDRYPGRPVNLVGYSGGAAMAVFVLEALPPERKVSTVVLLGASLSPEYDLSTALSRTERGIHNFYSPLDVPILMLMTGALGTSDGRHAFSAGALGFQAPAKQEGNSGGPPAAALVQQRYTLDMLPQGHPGGHFGWSNPAFVAQWVAPLLGSSDSKPITSGPKEFVGATAATQAPSAARPTRQELDHHAEVTVWDQNAFAPGLGSLESPEHRLLVSDAFTPQDESRMRCRLPSGRQRGDARG